MDTAPDYNFGATSCPIITPGDFCSIFNLVLPKEAHGKTCTLQFLFPLINETNAYYFHGDGVSIPPQAVHSHNAL